MFNWDTRYKSILENWGAELETGTVLEVGCGPFGIAKFIRNHVTGVEIGDVVTTLPNLKILKGDITDLPFTDNHFDYVICSDVLEHLNFNQRSKAISECIRVAQKKCIINGPHGDLALIGDSNFKHSFERLSHGLPNWLEEHFQHGFPEASKTLSDIFSNGYTPKILINETFFQHYSGLLIDIFYVNSSSIYSILSNKNGNSAIGSIDGDLPYSLLFCIDKSEAIKIQEDNFIKRGKLINQAVEDSLGITIFSIIHEAAHNAFINAYGNIDIFEVIQPFFVNGGQDTFFHQLKNPSGFFETQNIRCSELTAIHYIWRNNLFSDVVGICHYRRYLYLFPINLDKELKDQFQIHTKPEEFKDLIDNVENTKQIKLLLTQYDLLTSAPRLLDQTIENQYNINHFSQDYYTCIEILLKNYPYLGPVVFESMNSKQLYTSNIFITNSQNFNNICTVWFDILEKCSKNINISNRNNYQKRDIAFLSERVFDILIRHLKKLDYKICELPILHIDF